MARVVEDADGRTADLLKQWDGVLRELADS